MPTCRSCSKKLPDDLFGVNSKGSKLQSCSPCLKKRKERKLKGDGVTPGAEGAIEDKEPWYTASSPEGVLQSISSPIPTSQPHSLRITQPLSDSPWPLPSPTTSFPSSLSQPTSFVGASTIKYGLDSHKRLAYWEAATGQPVHPGAERYLRDMKELRGEMPSALLRPEQIPDDVAAGDSGPVSSAKQPRMTPSYGHGQAPAGQPNDRLRLELPSRLLRELSRQPTPDSFLRERLSSLFVTETSVSTTHGYAIIQFDTVDDARSAKASSAWEELLGPGIEAKWYDEETELAALKELRDQKAEDALSLGLSALALEQRERLLAPRQLGAH